MLKDEKPPKSNPQFSKAQLYIKLFAFVSGNISGFPAYMKDHKFEAVGENRITSYLCVYFEDKIGFLPFRFQNQAPAHDNRTHDIGVFQLKFDGRTFCAIEAKLLSVSSHSNQYVEGNTGGIERFKRNVHGTDLDYSIMVGYIQKENESHWFGRVNNKIDTLANATHDGQIEWSTKDKLKKIGQDLMHYEYESKHTRKGITPIILYHFWVHV